MIAVFAGPSLELAGARAILDADYRPPVRNGDVVRAVRDGARVIGIVDGAFEWTLAVWHKEILWALHEGVHVLGAASMGALRAAELAPFGMRGVGRVFELYRDGVLIDDDEVAVIHDPGAGFAPASDAMIDIRFTLRAAARDGIIGTRTRRQLGSIAKGLFYPDRRYDTILAAASRLESLDEGELRALAAWLPDHRVERKRADASELIAELRRLTAGEPGPFRAEFTLARSRFLEQLLERAR